MYIILQFLGLYKCHKLKGFIFRFPSLFSILFSNLLAHYLCPRRRTLLISEDFTHRLSFVRHHSLVHIVPAGAGFQKSLSPRGIIHSLRQDCLFFGRSVCIFYLLIMQSPNVLLSVVLLSFPLNLSPLYCRCHISQKMLG